MCFINKRRGSILTEFIIVLFIFLLFAQIINKSLIPLDTSLNKKDTLVSDEMSLMQLRKILLLSYDIEIIDNSLIYEYQEREFSLSSINNNLMIQPGTQIIIFDISNLYFFEDDLTIYMQYTKDGKDYERVLCKK